MARTHLSQDEHDLVCLVMENQPVTTDDLLQLCADHLGQSRNDAMNLFTGLLMRQILVVSGGQVTVQEDSEELQELVLEQAMERAEENAAQRRQDSENTPRGRMFSNHGEQKAPAAPVSPPSSRQASAPPGERPPMSNGTAAPSTPASSDSTAAQEQDQSQEQRPSRRLYLLIGGAAALVIALTLVLVSILRPPTYPRTVRSGGRELTLLTEPEGEAERAAEKWLIKFIKGRTTAGRHFETLTVRDMEVYQLDQRWNEEEADGAKSGSFDPAANFQGTVVFADALAAGGAEPESGTDYQYRLYLEGSEEDGYSVSACRSCPADWMEQYDSQTFQAGGEDYTLSVYGEGTEYGHRLRMAVLEHGGERQILYLNEQDGSDYDQQVQLTDLNGDGAMEIVIDDLDARQMCYLYDKSTGGYRFFAPLSGGHIVFSPALPGAVLFTRLEGEDVMASFYRWDEGGELVELARMESRGTGAGGRVCEYFADGKPVQQYTQDGSVMPGDLDQNQQMLFNQYMAYVFWDELVLETAQSQGYLALPETISPAEDWQPLTLLASYPTDDLSLYVSPSGLLLVRKGEKLQVIPCSFVGQNPLPTIADLDGDAQLDILLPFNDITPALLVARWNGADWTITGFDLDTLESDFKSGTALSWSGRSAQLNYEGAYGASSMRWTGGSISEGETGTLGLDMKSYALAFRNGGISVAFPVRIEREDGSIVESKLAFTADLRVPLEGNPEVTACRITRQ